MSTSSLRKPDVHLIFRIGSLGDMVVAVPAIRALKKNFPDDHFVLLVNRGSAKVFGMEIFEGSGLIDAYLEYPSESAGLGGKARELWSRLRALGAKRFSYLPSDRTYPQALRDRLFFGSVGFQRMLGFRGFSYRKRGARILAPKGSLHEADRLLARLHADGLDVPGVGCGDMDLGLGPAEETEFALWRGGLGSDGGRPWLAVAPFSNQPSKRWPEERYQWVVGRLIKDFGVWPVVFGSASERGKAGALIESWACGFNAAGVLGVRTAAWGLGRCKLFLGSDSGPIHLAAAVGLPCVGIYSSHGEPGKWSPYGPGHVVLRTDPDCAGCELFECTTQGLRCLMDISMERVYAVTAARWKELM